MTGFDVRAAMRGHLANVTDAEQVVRALKGLIQHHEREIDVHSQAIATLRKSVGLAGAAAQSFQAQAEALKARLPVEQKS